MTAPMLAVDHAFCTLLGKVDYVELRQQWTRSNQAVDSVAGLSPDEMFAIWIYTTPRSYFSLINTPLHASVEPAYIRVIADLIDAGLRKLPIHQGRLYRGVSVPDPELFVSLHPVGREIVWSAFSSCTIDPEAAYPAATLFVIDAKRAPRVTYYSGANEDEFVLSIGTRVRVEQSVYFEQQDRAVITVSELD